MDQAERDMQDFLEKPGARILSSILTDSSITEVMINGPDTVFVERKGKMELSEVRFESSDQLRFLIETIVRPSGRTIDAHSPFVDCRLPDGSRVNIVLPPIALNGATVTIRKFTKELREPNHLVEVGTLTPKMSTFLAAAVKARANIMFSGATGTGKTTTLGIYSSAISDQERIIIIEDTAELELNQKHVVRLECRPPNVEGSGEVTLEQLLKNSLRMRPTRIILGEIRGGEAVEFLQAVRSGHDGCLAVMHASSPGDAIGRLELMTLSRGYALPLWGVQSQIAGGLDLIVQHEQLVDGSRKITHLTEVTGVTEAGVTLRDLYTFEHGEVDAAGKVQGGWVCSGEVPQFAPRFQHHGVELPADLFEAGPA